jgi:hypothetical protein
MIISCERCGGLATEKMSPKMSPLVGDIRRFYVKKDSYPTNVSDQRSGRLFLLVPVRTSNLCLRIEYSYIVHSDTRYKIRTPGFLLSSFYDQIRLRIHDYSQDQIERLI